MIAFTTSIGVRALHELQVKALQNSQTGNSKLHSEDEAGHNKGGDIEPGKSSGQ